MLPPPPGLSILVLLGAVLAGIVAVTAYRKRPDPLAIPLTVLMLACVGWAIPAAIGYWAPTQSIAITAEMARYPGTVLAPIGFYVVACRFADRPRMIGSRVLAAIGVIPVITLALVWTSGHHDLFWQSVHPHEVVGGTILVTEPGPWFFAHMGWAYLLMLGSLAMLAQEVRRADPFNRKQAVAVFAGGFLPLFVNVTGHAGYWRGVHAELTPVALAVSGGIFAVGIYRLDLIELGPIARYRILEEIPDGVVVVDADDHIRKYNSVAAAMFEDIEIDADVQTVIPDTFERSGGEAALTVAGERRHYRCDRRGFFDNHGRQFGELLYFRDISAVARREQRISVLNRVLRHNIRNELTIQVGHLDLLARELGTHHDEHVDTIRRSIERIEAFADRARLVDRTLREPDDTRSVAIEPALEAAIDELQARLDGVTVNRPDLDPGLAVEVIDEELLAWVLAEVLENAVTHGGADVIEVEIEDRAETTRIAIIDDGPGIPDAEMDALRSTVETALEHGSGVGLWLARWTAERSGGSIAFESQNGSNAVILTFPRAETTADPSTTAPPPAQATMR